MKYLIINCFHIYLFLTHSEVLLYIQWLPIMDITSQLSALISGLLVVWLLPNSENLFVSDPWCGRGSGRVEIYSVSLDFSVFIDCWFLDL